MADQKQRDRQREWYQKHKPRIISARKRTHHEKVRKFQDFKATLFCEICGENDPRCLDFHHLNNKERNLADIVRSWSWEKIMKEVKKCKVLCANCHRKLGLTVTG